MWRGGRSRRPGSAAGEWSYDRVWVGPEVLSCPMLCGDRSRDGARTLSRFDSALLGALSRNQRGVVPSDFEEETHR
jgi:hypothetical protein